jgi:hypothetical protein
MYYSQKLYKISIEYVRLIKIFLSAALVYSGAMFISQRTRLSAPLLNLLFLMLYPLLLALFGFYSPAEKSRTIKVLSLFGRSFKSKFVKGDN